MNITNEKLASIIIRFLKEKQNLTYYSISEKTGADQKSIKEWELQQSLERTRRLRPDLLKEE